MAAADAEKAVFNDNVDGFKTYSFKTLAKLPVFLRKRRRAAALGSDNGGSCAKAPSTTAPVIDIQPPTNDQNVSLSASSHQKANSFFAKLSTTTAAQTIPASENVAFVDDHFAGSSCSPRERTNSKTFTQTWHSALGRLKSQVDPWSDFQRYPVERCTRYRYDAAKGEWSEDVVLVQIEPTPFGHGAMRQCHRLKLIRYTNDERKLGTRTFYSAQNYVAKRYMDAVEAVMYFDDVRMQMAAKLYAELYSKLEMAPKKVDVMQMWVVEFTERANAPLFHLEPFIEGTYEKYNSNSGFLSRMARATPQTFSHYSFEISNKQLVVCDIQGVGDLYTDPQIHTVCGTDYGDGNLGIKGMALFFHTHRCNELCRAMELKPFPLSEKELLVQKNHEAANNSRQPSRRASFSDNNVVIAPEAAKEQEIVRPSVTYTMRMSSLSRPDEALQSVKSVSLADEAGHVSELSTIGEQNKYVPAGLTKPRKKSTLSESSDSSYIAGLGQPCIGAIPLLRRRLPASFTRTMSLLVGENFSDEKASGKSRSGTESRRERRTRFSNMSTTSISEDAVEAMSDDENEADDSVYDEYADSGINSSRLKLSNSKEGRSQRSMRNSESSAGELGEGKRDVIGQVHLEMVKYHELGRFAAMDNSSEDGEPYEVGNAAMETDSHTCDMRAFSGDANSANYDRDSALFHLRAAAEHGQREALHAIADICLGLPHDLLVDVTIENGLNFASAPVEWRDDPVSLGYDRLLRCAESGDRDCMARVGRSMFAGVPDAKSERWNVPQWKAAVAWYERAAAAQLAQSSSEPSSPTPPTSRATGGGAVLDNPNWILLASAAEMLLKGGNSLEKDPQRAGDLYAQAAELAADAMQGKLSTKYYCLSEEAYGQLEEEEN